MNTLALILALACGQEQAPEPTGPTGWRSEVALEIPSKLGGCAVGELLPEHAGSEIAAVAGDGGVYVAWREGGEWKSEKVWQAPGEAVQCVIGDADPRYPGNEILCVGMAEGEEDHLLPGAVYAVWRADGAWHGERILRTEFLLHAVAVGDGGVYASGFTEGLHWMEVVEDGWHTADLARFRKVAPKHLQHIMAAGKSMVVVGPERVAICATNGGLYVASKGPKDWVTVTIDGRPAGRARLAYDGKRYLTADEDGKLVLVGRNLRSNVTLYSESDKLRGAVLADLDPTSPELEAACAGYSGNVVVVRETADGWVPETVFTDTDKLHHLASGDLDGRPGEELVTCGYSGRLVVIRRK